MQRVNQLLSLLSASLVLFLAGSAFFLSFESLKGLAIQMGVAESIAWLYPAIIDGAIIVFSLSVLRANLNRENILYPWALVSLFTILSVVLNIIHAHQDFLAQFLAAIPPIALFLSFELLMSQLKASAIRLQAIHSLSEITKAIQEKQAELDAVIANRTAELDGIVQERTVYLENLDGQIKQLESKMSNLKEEIGHKNGKVEESIPVAIVRTGQTRPDRTTRKQDAIQQLFTYLADHPDASLSEMAVAIGRSKSTAGAYVSELEMNGMLKKDTQGWQIVDEYKEKAPVG